MNFVQRFLHRKSPLALAAAAALFLTACGGSQVKKQPNKPVEAAPAPVTDGRPAVVPLSDVAFPKPEKFVVTGGGEPTADAPGLELIVVKRTQLPAVFVRWVFPGGRAVEFSGGEGARWPEGTIDLMAEMLTEGTKQHRGTAFAAAMQGHGGELKFSVLADALIASGQTLNHQLKPYLGLVSEALTSPEFGSKAANSLQKRWSAHLKNLSTRPTSIGARVLNRVMYGANHPYGSPGPTMQTIHKINTRHMRSAQQAALSLAGSTLIVVGDVDSATLIETVRAVFGKQLDGKVDTSKAPLPPKPEPEGCHVVDVPGAVQTVILQGNLALARSAATWPQAVVANQVLGGSASSRLFTVLRERRGLTYGIYSSLDGRKIAGDWSVSASVRTPKTEEALAAIGQEMALVRAQEAQPDEIGNAKRKLAGNFVTSVARGGHVAARLASQQLYGLGEGYWGSYVGSLQAVTASQLRQSAADFFSSPGKATVLVGNIEAIRPSIDRHCPRMALRDENATLLEVLVGDDAAMTDAGRAKLFGGWARDDVGLDPLGQFVRDATHSTAIRADALVALLETSRQKHLIATGRGAKDWPKMAIDVLDRLIASFKLMADEHDLKRAFNAHEVLLDLVDPPDGKKTVLTEADVAIARKAIADWAFASITPDTPSKDTETLVTKRLIPPDLVRLGESSIAGLEALVSANVWRVEAGRALRGQESVASIRALWRGYRRAFVERGGLPDPADLEVLGSLPTAQTALLLFDVHAMHQRDPTPPQKTAAATTMDTLRHLLDEMGHEKSNEPSDRDSQRSVLDREFNRFVRPLETAMRFDNADDRWWAAKMLIRHKGVVGLRLVMQGLKDDDNYGAVGLHTIDPKLQIGDLCRNEIAPLGRSNVQAVMLAALVGRHRLGKIIAITVLKTFGDTGSMTALRTHRDRTDVAKILGLPGTVRVTRLAASAVDVHKFLDEIDREQRAGKISPAVAKLHKEFAFYTFDLLGNKLRSEVARKVRERLAAMGAQAGAPAGATETPAKGTNADGTTTKGAKTAKKGAKSAKPAAEGPPNSDSGDGDK